MSHYPSYLEQFSLLNNEQKKILGNIIHLNEIEGWLLLTEAIELFSISSKIIGPNPIICEIGTWKGKSAYVFASAIQHKGTLYCVDPFNGDGDSASMESYQDSLKNMDVSLLQNFEKTMRKYGLWNCIKVLPFHSEPARKKFNEPNIDLLFIDGDHEFESVKKDYELWSPLISSGGTIVLHDVAATHVDGPRRVMQEFIVGNKIWENVRMVGEMGVADKI